MRCRSRSRSRRDRRKSNVSSKLHASPNKESNQSDEVAPRRRSSLLPSPTKPARRLSSSQSSRKLVDFSDASPHALQKKPMSPGRFSVETPIVTSRKDPDLQNAIHMCSPQGSETSGNNHSSSNRRHQLRKPSSTFRLVPPPPAPYDCSPLANSIKAFASEGCHSNSYRSGALTRRLYRQQSLENNLSDELSGRQSRRSLPRFSNENSFAVDSTSSSNTLNSTSTPSSAIRCDDYEMSTPSTSSRGRRVPNVESPTGVDEFPLDSRLEPERKRAPAPPPSPTKVLSKYRKEIQSNLDRLDRLKGRSSRRVTIS